MTNNRDCVPRIPKIAQWILKKSISEDIRYSAIGDFDEIFSDIAKNENETKARFWYWRQAIKSLPSFVLDASFWRFVMLKNYLMSTLRNMQRNKLVTLLNTLGLTVGIVSTVLILLFIKDELSYDMHHPQHENIYRISSVFHFGEQEDRYAFTPMGFGPALKEEFPEIKEFARFRKLETVYVQYQNKEFHETNIFYGDTSIFEIFSHPFLYGAPENALKDPFSVILTYSMAKKFFGKNNPVGESIRLNGSDFNITGVIEDLKWNSHLRFDALVPIESYKFFGGEENFLRAQSFWIVSMYTYFLMQEGSSIQNVLDKFSVFFEKNMKIEGRENVWFDIEALPLADIHFQSNIPYDLPVENFVNIYIFGAIAVFILFIAVINYLNMATALSSKREKEVGMRKVVGAKKNQLLSQFLSEALILSLAAWLFSLAGVRVIMPSFNSLSDKDISFGLRASPDIFLASLAIAFFIGLLAGIYPALLMSSFQPVKALRGMYQKGGSKGRLRKTLVVFQFSLSVCVIIATFVVSRQLHFIQNKDLGYSKENVMVIPMRSMNYQGDMSTLKSEIKKNAHIQAVAGASHIVGNELTRNAFFIDKNDEITQVSLIWFSVDYDFLDMMDIKLKEGRNFSPDFSTDEDSSFMVNETAIRELGWGQRALGRQRRYSFDADNNPVFDKVIGVVEDFNYGPLHNIIEPVLIFLNPNPPNFLYIKINPGDLSSSIRHIKTVMRDLGMQIPPDYFFLDNNLYQHYRSEEILRKLFGIFALLCIFISCLGLLGLSYFMVTKKTKEIGIRKILGASEPTIVALLSKEFVKSVLIANFIAWPVAFFVMSRWLQNFAYRTEFGWQPFVLSSILSFAIALLTVSFQTIKAARNNPVNNLRDE